MAQHAPVLPPNNSLSLRGAQTCTVVLVPHVGYVGNRVSRSRGDHNESPGRPLSNIRVLHLHCSVNSICGKTQITSHTSKRAQVRKSLTSLRSGHESSSGVPQSEYIKSSCCCSCVPGRIGLSYSSSARIHPTDHMSTAGPY